MARSSFVTPVSSVSKVSYRSGATRGTEGVSPKKSLVGLDASTDFVLSESCTI
jgi:hypothetical protein